jgi:hypothetical protein
MRQGFRSFLDLRERSFYLSVKSQGLSAPAAEFFFFYIPIEFGIGVIMDYW